MTINKDCPRISTDFHGLKIKLSKQVIRVNPCNPWTLLLLFVLSINISHAQENINQIEVPIRFIHRLSWTAHEHALRYEVEIEKEDEEKTYSKFLLENTEESILHISLPAGKYRFRVIPYDLFNRPGVITEYQYFEIKQASGKTSDEPQTPANLFNFYLGISYLTHINIHGEKDFVTNPEQFLSGASLRLAIVSVGTKYFNLGGEIIPAWYSVESLFDDTKAKSFLLEANILLQKDLFRRKAGFVVRAGAGITYSFSEKPVEEQNETAFYANMGFSFIWQPVKYFYLEIGANYSYLFAIENPTGRVRPFVGLGTRLGK